MENDESKQLTPADFDLLREFIEEFDAVMERKPLPIPAETWDKVTPEIQRTFVVPAEYRDRIGVTEYSEPNDPDDTKHLRFYDIQGEKWEREHAQITEKYHDVIVKALRYVITNGIQTEDPRILDIVRQLIAEDKATLPAVIAHELKSINFPVDKVNKDIWHLLETNPNGQVTIAYNVAKKGNKKPIEILYCLDFSQLHNVSITRKLEPYDKRVYLSIAAIFNHGYDVMSIQQIYNGMGYKGRVGARDIQKINTSISKMNGAHLYIDNLAESNVYKYDHFTYDGVLLPMERIQAIVKGQTADAVIHVFREPPMVSFARERKQITPIDIKILDTPLNKTSSNIELEDYLIEEISAIRKGRRNNKMLYKTIYESTNIKTAKQQQRAPGKIKQLLDHYVTCGFIKAYKETKDGVTIEY